MRLLSRGVVVVGVATLACRNRGGMWLVGIVERRLGR